MAIAYLTSTIKASNTDTVTTDAIDTSGADLLVLYAVQQTATVTPDAPTDSKGNSWTKGTPFADPMGIYMTVYWCKPTSVGTGHTFTYATTGTTTGPEVVVLAFSGSVASSPFDDQTDATTTDTPVTSLQMTSLTPSEANCLLIACHLSKYDSGTLSINQSYTLAQSNEDSVPNNYSMGAAYLIQTSAAASAPTYSWPNTHSAGGLLVSFKAATATGQFARPASDVSPNGILRFDCVGHHLIG